MASFILTYDAQSGRNYDDLYAAMAEYSGVRLAESVWGLELNNTPGEVRAWARALLDDDDTIVVVQLRPEISWASRHASSEAVEWLKNQLSS